MGTFGQNIHRYRYYDRKMVERNAAEEDVDFQIPQDDITGTAVNKAKDSAEQQENNKYARSCSMVSTTMDLNQPDSRKSWIALKKLSRNVSFHLLVQGFALYSSPFLGYTVNLNEWCLKKFPGKEFEISVMGFSAIVCGLVALSLTGVLIDRTHR